MTYIYATVSQEQWAEIKSDEKELALEGTIIPKDKLVVLFTNKQRHLVFPFELFEPNMKYAPDFTQFEIVDWGQTLKFGEYEAALDALIQDVEYRREEIYEVKVPEYTEPEKTTKELYVSPRDFPTIQSLMDFCARNNLNPAKVYIDEDYDGTYLIVTLDQYAQLTEEDKTNLWWEDE